MYIDTGAVFCGNLTLIQVQEKARGHKRTKPHQRTARVADGWLELWGAWVYSGRLEKRMAA